MITVRIDEDDLKEMFYERLKFWDMSDEQYQMLADYLDELVDGGCFEGAELNIPVIVDNLYVNDTSFIYEGDADWDNMRVGKDDQDDRVVMVRDGIALVQW